MSDKTGIEWTDATWNPIRGCSRVSEGCRNCYAESMAYRFSGPGKAYEGLVQVASLGGGSPEVRLPKWNGQIRFVEKHLLDPLRCKTPRRIFVNSMSDLFHKDVTDGMLDRIFAVMALCPRHEFQVVTKRPERMLAYLTPTASNYQPARIFDAAEEVPSSRTGVPTIDREASWPLPNVWLGVSAENQAAADRRIPLLLQTPAAVRFVSLEPLLGPINLRPWIDVEFVANCRDCEPMDQTTRHLLNKMARAAYRNEGGAVLDWVIVGGESGKGPGIRPMHPDWARSLRDQCVAADVPFFFKQWGEWVPFVAAAGEKVTVDSGLWMSAAGEMRTHNLVRGDAWLRRVGKKAAGDLLDGRQWHDFPAAAGEGKQ